MSLKARLKQLEKIRDKKDFKVYIFSKIDDDLYESYDGTETYDKDYVEKLSANKNNHVIEVVCK